MKESSSQIVPPGLYIIATPIGNLGDITVRALDTLQQMDQIACEDTRVSATLLSHYGIKKPCISYNDHNGAQRRPQLIQAMQQGQKIALISDAGTPLVSDPGYKLVQAARDAGLHVTTLPGASSVLAALCLSGLPCDRFFFAGFLPTKEQALRTTLQSLGTIPATLVCFESARRLPDTLAVAHAILGNRKAAIARELTKLHEDVTCNTLEALQAHYQQAATPKGEIVLVIGAPEAMPAAEEDIQHKLARLLHDHSIKDAVAMVAEATGRPRREVYAIALAMKDDD